MRAAPRSPVPPVMTITRRVRFAAARRLASPALDEAGNARLFGRDRLTHGHDFTLEVTLRGEVPAATGMVMDLKALSDLLRGEIVARADHTDLGTSDLAAGLPPTTENLVVAIWRRLVGSLPPGALVEVALGEGRERRVFYRGGEEAWKS